MHICKFFRNFAQNFEETMTFSDFWTTIKIRKWGKYVITILAFLVVFLFVGDQSLLHFIHRHREIRHYEEQRDMYLEGAEKAQRVQKLMGKHGGEEKQARDPELYRRFV